MRKEDIMSRPAKVLSQAQRDEYFNDGAVVVPAEGANIHNEKIVEIISGEKLRSALNIEDGDLVTIRFEKPLVA